MAYDEGLAERIREVMPHPFDERKMFGGLAFMIGGNMCVGVVGDDLMVRVGKDGYADAIVRPHAREMDFTGRVSTGMVYVGPKGVADKRALQGWVTRGVRFAQSLPAKRKR